jgi:nitrite reductase/ring-hydroxylating ferredoxin subunit
VATGYSGNGMTFGTIAGQLLSDLIAEVDNGLEPLFRPSRIKPLAAAASYFAENVGSTVCFVEGRIAPADAASIADVPKGAGRLVDQEGRRLAVYRDPEGRVHACSPVCPHLGCIVQWNNAEKSWDCPCHGSRFSGTGAVLHGPAHEALKAVSLDEEELEKRGAA